MITGLWEEGNAKQCCISFFYPILIHTTLNIVVLVQSAHSLNFIFHLLATFTPVPSRRRPTHLWQKHHQRSMYLRVGIINHSELLLLLISTTTMNFFIFPFLYCFLFDHYSPSQNCTMTVLCMSKAHKRNVSHKLDSEVINSQVHEEMSSISSSRRNGNY